ncbi:ATP synthase subunit 9 [Citrus sinensis]|nr:ATP synthase subunit 9 [Citrus sinensis]
MARLLELYPHEEWMSLAQLSFFFLGYKRPAKSMLEGAKLMGAGAATIASAGAAVGIGNVFSSLIHSVARNPSLAKQSFGYAILGFALTEAIATEKI